MKVKDKTKELEQLLKIAPREDASMASAADSSLPEEVLPEPEPLFALDFEREKRRLMKRAKATVTKLIKLILPEEMLNDEFIQDKLVQDADQLSSLYWQKECIEIMQKTLMETVAKGNASPRFFETFTEISKNHSDISDQISKFETFLRKNYLDIKYDLIDRKDGQLMLEGRQAIEYDKDSEQDGSVTIYSTKDFIKNAQKDRMKILKAKYQEEE